MYEERMEDHLEDQQENESEEFCYYCGEPLENGLCSSYCHESEADEGRDCECEDRDD